MDSNHLKRLSWLSAWLVLVVGCSKDDLGKLADRAKSAVTEGKEAVAKNVEAAKKTMGNTTAEVQEQLKMAGSIELTAGSSFKTEACYASLLQQGSGRPAVFQLRSYRDVESEAFPSVFLQAQVRANSASELVSSEAIEARLFVQVEKDGNVLFSKADTPVKLKITSVNGTSLKAELAEASLFDTATGESVAAAGHFEGVLP